MNVTWTDFEGNEIKPGCKVVYPVRLGSRLWLEKITVTGIMPEGVLTGFKANGRRVRVKNLNNCVVVNREP